MGIEYSKVICINPVNKCSYGSNAVPYSVYRKLKPEERQKTVCGSYSGQIQQCCDPKDTQPVINSTPIKVIKNSQGKVIEYHRCLCNDSVCRQKYCSDFQMPTQYGLCKARAVRLKDEVKLNEHVTQIIAANTYPDCYAPCQKK